MSQTEMPYPPVSGIQPPGPVTTPFSSRPIAVAVPVGKRDGGAQYAWAV